MLYNVAQLLKEPTGSTRTYQVDEAFTGSQRMADKVQGSVRLLRTHHGALVKAKLEIGATLTCSRCLIEFYRSSTLQIEEECFPTIDLHTGRKTSPPPESEGVIHINDSHVLDLTEVVRQYALTNEPMKPLCRAGCLGLCAMCGSNLNQARCGCQVLEVDPRWGALNGLLQEHTG